MLKNERMKIEGRKSREREKNVILHYLLEEIGKGKKSGLDGVFHLNLPFFSPYKEKKRENNIDKKKYNITLNFSSICFQAHEYNSNLLSIILYNFFFHAIKAIYHQYFDFPLLLHWSKIFHFLFFFFWVRYQLSKSDEFVMHSNSLR